MNLVPPYFSNCPSNHSYMFATDYNSATATASWPPIYAFDTIEPNPVTQYITNPPGLYNGAAFPVGNTSVQFIATDVSNNVAVCQFYVVVVDNQPPVAKCPDSFTQNCVAPLRHANVSWQVPYFTDPVGIISQTVSRSPGLYSAGTYDVYATATNKYGLSSNCSFQFTLWSDTAPPVITCPSSQLVTTDQDKATALVSWTLPTIFDESQYKTSYVPSLYPPAAFAVGVTTMNFTATGSLHSRHFN